MLSPTPHMLIIHTRVSCELYSGNVKPHSESCLMLAFSSLLWKGAIDLHHFQASQGTCCIEASPLLHSLTMQRVQGKKGCLCLRLSGSLNILSPISCLLSSLWTWPCTWHRSSFPCMTNLVICARATLRRVRVCNLWHGLHSKVMTWEGSSFLSQTPLILLRSPSTGTCSCKKHDPQPSRVVTAPCPCSPGTNKLCSATYPAVFFWWQHGGSLVLERLDLEPEERILDVG